VNEISALSSGPFVFCTDPSINLLMNAALAAPGYFSVEVRQYDAHCHEALHLLTDRVLRLEAQQSWLLVQVEELFARIETLSVRVEMESALREEVQP
jgi:hypothetical protein